MELFDPPLEPVAAHGREPGWIEAETLLEPCIPCHEGALRRLFGAADQGRPLLHPLDRTDFAVAAQHRVRMRLHRETGSRSRRQELAARFAVALRKVGGGCTHRGIANHFSAMRTQAVAPSGISSSLKS